MSGKPAARITDSVVKGKIVTGSLTVLIGSQGGLACSVCPGGITVGQTEQARPPWLPMSTVSEPVTILPLTTLSVMRAAGLPLMRGCSWRGERERDGG